MAAKSLCKVSGCDKGEYSRGMCQKHYTRFRRNGSTDKRRKPDPVVCNVSGCLSQAKSAGMCLKHYKRKWATGSVHLEKFGHDEYRDFLNTAVSSETDDCIVWPHNHAARCAGQVSAFGRRMPGTHYVLEMTEGPRPSAEHVAAHLPIICHNPSCLNPRHIRWATTAENNRDMVIDGTTQRGQKHPRSKLSPDDVRAIRADSRIGAEIAAAYGISRSLVYGIKSRANWGWLD